MIKVDYHSTRSILLEMRVRLIVERTRLYWDTSQDFEDEFNDKLGKLARTNAVWPDQAFKLKRIDDITLELWHHTLCGDPDRRICTITEVKEAHES